MFSRIALWALLYPISALSQKVVLTNDDGWAAASIRAQYNALNDANYDVVLSCPAENGSGTGSLSVTPFILLLPCEFNSCPIGSPAEGFNASDPRINYVNAFPVDAARYGIQTLAPKFFDGEKPDFVVSGPNVGSNLGISTFFSGTIGAASEAVKEGIPSAAFSGVSGSEVSYTTLDSSPTSTSTLAALTYAALTVKFLSVLFSSSAAPILPPNVSLNVNYPAIDNCTSVSDFDFVLSRIYSDSSAVDVETCGGSTLPTESTVVNTDGCFASVSVFNASTKLDVDSATQEFVLEKLSGLLTCLPA